ncbi:hypothetical protein E4S40_15660 [Algoriphagus kandeliae]|uniref:Uncharacterized protein n=1 Tax=Algoriphagus kandeliae TaxID=2562278 RepID=A0A4Y9QLX4_9BACT|nr:hypothetical protein [Algoriphagus kandeliae]TFV93679.1 hypothetical protein E4S40_15660 [Algoriphagus kandeliae]
MKLKPILKALIYLAVFVSSSKLAKAQTSHTPIPAEIMFGNERLDFQLIVKRSFSPTSKFSLVAISIFAQNYDRERTLGNSIVAPVQVTYKLGKSGFSLAAGAEANSKVGFMPMAGVQHVFANREVLALTFVNMLSNQGANGQIFGIYEYKPRLNDTWSIYSRIQLMYIQGISETAHKRSFLYLRAGLKKGPLGFGIGANWDAYGTERQTAQNFGVFTRWEF